MPLFSFLFLQFPQSTLREIKLLQTLDHENIIKLIEVCQGEGMPKSIMFLIPPLR